jgi:hypothetical protein
MSDSGSDSCENEHGYFLTMSVHSGGYEDCSCCNDDGDKPRLPHFHIGSFTSDIDDASTIKDNPRGKSSSRDIDEDYSDEETADKQSQELNEESPEGLKDSLEDEEDASDDDASSKSSAMTDYTYEELDIETGKMIRHCPRSMPLHPFLWRGREFLREDNQTTFIQTTESCTQSVETWGPSISYVQDEFVTFELCKKAIKNNAYSISSINRRLLSEEDYYKLCLFAVKKNGYTLRDIPGDVQTQEMCEIAVKSSCWALPFCYRNFRTPELCLDALSKNGETMKHVPSEIITSEMCLAAVNTEFPCLEHVPKEYITEELCIAAIKSSGENLKAVPEEFMTHELCLAAVKSSGTKQSSMAGNNLRYVPAKYMSKEIILECLSKWGSAYNWIPAEVLTDELINDILDVAPHCIQYIEHTPDRCFKAIKANLFLVECIKKSEITKEMAEYLLPFHNEKCVFLPKSLEHLKTLLNKTN